jgi:hypothetical protein
MRLGSIGALVLSCGVAGALFYFTHHLGIYGSVGASLVIGMAVYRATQGYMDPPTPQQEGPTEQNAPTTHEASDEMEEVIASLRSLCKEIEERGKGTGQHAARFMELLKRYDRALDDASDQQVQAGLEQVRRCSLLLKSRR